MKWSDGIILQNDITTFFFFFRKKCSKKYHWYFLKKYQQFFGKGNSLSKNISLTFLSHFHFSHGSSPFNLARRANFTPKIIWLSNSHITQYIFWHLPISKQTEPSVATLEPAIKCILHFIKCLCYPLFKSVYYTFF